MSRFPHFIQPNIMDCGATCLQIIARHYGRTLPLSFLREASHTGRDGASLLGISKAAEAVGFHTLAVKIDFNKLQKEAPLPLIAHWNQNHFVVVYKITRDKVLVSDPGNSLLTYTHAEFLRQWINATADKHTEEGICLLLEPTPAFKATEIPREDEERLDTKAFLWHYLRPHKRIMLQILIGLVAGTLLQLMIPFLTQNIVDTGIYKKDISFIWLVLAAQLMLTLGQMTLEILRSWMLLHVSSRINISLISDFFIKLMKLPIRYFDTKLSGDLLQRIQDHHQIESFLTGTSLSALFSTFNLLLYGCILAYYSLPLFGIFLVGSLLHVGWILFFLERRKKLNYKRFQQAGQTNSKVMELINGMQEIKLHNAEQQKRWGWERIQVKLYRVGVQGLSLEQTQSAGSRIINELKNIFTTVISAKLVIDGQLTLGMMLSVTYIIGQLNSPILQLVDVIRSWQDARISLERLTEIHQKEEEIPTQSFQHTSERSFEPVPPHHQIRLVQVSFAYDALSAEVLRNITMDIPAGKVTAIVGASGSGKTTLLKLLMRFYEPVGGEILVDKTRLAQTHIEDWRNQCGVVMQEGFIFNDTIAGNIAVGVDVPDWDRLRHAVKVANIADFIEQLPLRFNTKIGQEGLGISTGQKQRLLIARAVYKNPDILFFDEATSALDANNEKLIMEQLQEFYKGKTVVVIAHRLSTVRDADNIVVLEHGCIVEQGTHDELVATKGRYYTLVKNQLELGR